MIPGYFVKLDSFPHTANGKIDLLKLPKPDENSNSFLSDFIEPEGKTEIIIASVWKEILKKDYGLDPSQNQVIPHGIHQVPHSTSDFAKSSLGLSGKIVLSTFGFLSSSKGIEYVIDALPKVVEKFPKVRFLIAGVTHPVILEHEGESYRNFLTKRVRQLGLNKHVSFYNTYFDIDKLLKFLESTDVYLSPSLNPEQTVSGTLSYALGSGRPVISTAFAQAKQDITDEVGILVDFKKPKALKVV